VLNLFCDSCDEEVICLAAFHIELMCRCAHSISTLYNASLKLLWPPASTIINIIIHIIIIIIFYFVRHILYWGLMSNSRPYCCLPWNDYSSEMPSAPLPRKANLQLVSPNRSLVRHPLRRPIEKFIAENWMQSDSIGRTPVTSPATAPSI